ncbi:hypothetical protein J6590_053317 [Homalodisca vitripennis]|nr:hypothetical protein J6590_053317 [Homalodisca vitripennis]
MRENRDLFDDVESKALKLAEKEEAVYDKVRKRKLLPDEKDRSVEETSPRERFRTGVFIVIVDNIASQLNRRREECNHFKQRIVLENLSKIKDMYAYIKSNGLEKIFSNLEVALRAGGGANIAANFKVELGSKKAGLLESGLNNETFFEKSLEMPYSFFRFTVNGRLQIPVIHGKEHKRYKGIEAQLSRMIELQKNLESGEWKNQGNEEEGKETKGKPKLRRYKIIPIIPSNGEGYFLALKGSLPQRTVNIPGTTIKIKSMILNPMYTS